MQKYQVLARKYRPQRFEDVVGQEAVVTTLKNALKFQKVAHAYLFSGSRGVGKTTLARLFAKALNCEALNQDLEPCNKCTSCQTIMAGQSLDVIEIDGASNRGIDDIREINETIGYAPTHGRYKIYIIDEVHMLTKEAFNALLKTLEEPPEKAKFFFATTEAHKVLPTIISRCQRFDLGKISQQQIIAKLEQIASDLKRDAESSALHKIAMLADGSLRDAESLFDQILCFLDGPVTVHSVQEMFGLIDQEQFFALDRAFAEGDFSFAFSLTHHLMQTGKNISHFFSQLIEHYRSLSLYKTLGETALPPAQAPRYAASASLYIQPQCLYILEYLLNAEISLQKSLSQRIFLEMTILHIIKSKHRIPIEVLTRRLSELEQSIKTAPPTQLTLSTTSIVKEMTSPQETLFKEPKTSPENDLKALHSTASTTQKPALQENKPPQAPPLKEAPKAHPETEIKTPNLPSTTIQNSTFQENTHIQESLFKEPEAHLEIDPKTPATPPMAIQKPTLSKPIMSAEKIQAPVTTQSATPSRPSSHYDTLMRFAAVELEGSLKIH